MDIIDLIEQADYDDDVDDDEYRNARRGRGRGRGRSIVVRRRGGMSNKRGGGRGRSPIEHKYGGLKWGLILDAAAKGLAAIQPLPAAPTMGTDATKNMQNLVDYHETLAQHAKKSQQLTTLGSIGKVFLT